MTIHETEERPDDGAYLEIWIDISGVGEPVQIFFQPVQADGTAAFGHEMLGEYIEAVEGDGVVEICLKVEVIEGREWVLHAEDVSVAGGVSYWVKFKD